VKPQAKPTAPQFGHDGIDPLRAALILGLPLFATSVLLLVLFASPLVWWIAGGVAAAGVAGAVVLRRSRRARGLLRRMPGAGRAATALRRTANGRFARSPLGRVVGRALGRRSPGASSGGSPSRPKTLGGRLRSMLPAWAGGTRGKRSGGSGGASSGGRMRSLLSRLKPGGGRRPASSGGSPGGRPGRLGGASQSGGKPKPGSLLSRAARSVGRTTGKASRAVGSKLFRIRPATSSSGGSSTKPNGKGKKKPSGGGGSGDSSGLDLGVVWAGAGKAGKLLGRGMGALFGRLRHRKKTEPGDDFDKDSTYEIGIEGEVIDGKHTDAELGRIAAQARKDAAKRAKKLAKQRAKQEKQPQWPTAEPDDGWPNADPDAVADVPAPAHPAPAAREPKTPGKRDRDPPPSPPASPPSHRETPREAPRITSTNTKHGGNKMAVSAENYAHHIKTTPAGRASGWEDAADHARRDADSFKEKADAKIRAAEAFEKTGNKAAADECRTDAAKFREDESSCRTIAAGYQAEANKESSSAA
jgi:hypothetical protein